MFAERIRTVLYRLKNQYVSDIIHFRLKVIADSPNVLQIGTGYLL